MKVIAEEYRYFANEKPKIKFILQKSTPGQGLGRKRRSENRDLEQRIAALERRFEDGKNLSKIQPGQEGVSELGIHNVTIHASDFDPAVVIDGVKLTGIQRVAITKSAIGPVKVELVGTVSNEVQICP